MINFKREVFLLVHGFPAIVGWPCWPWACEGQHVMVETHVRVKLVGSFPGSKRDEEEGGPITLFKDVRPVT